MPQISLVPRDARGRIVGQWRHYERRAGFNRDMEMAEFFRWLETDHPELLRFRFHGSKWEVVRAWLVRAERASN